MEENVEKIEKWYSIIFINKQNNAISEYIVSSFLALHIILYLLKSVFSVGAHGNSSNKGKGDSFISVNALRDFISTLALASYFNKGMLKKLRPYQSILNHFLFPKKKNLKFL